MRPLFTLLLVACTGELTSSDMLEDVDARLGGEGIADEAYEASGFATVAGSDRDYTLAIEGEARVLDIHAPGMSDLSVLDGDELTLTIWTDDYAEGVGTFDISDEAGRVWLATRGGDGAAVLNSRFGEGFAQLGHKLGGERGDGVRYVFRAVELATDEGAVDLEPGEVATVTVGGQAWRVAVLAAYDIVETGFARSKCGGPTQSQSVEMLRLDTADATDDLIVRPTDLVASLYSGC